MSWSRLRLLLNLKPPSQRQHLPKLNRWRRALIPLPSAVTRWFGSLCHNKQRGEATDNPNPWWLCTSICFSWHFSLSSHRSTDLRVENTFPEKLFFSCTLCGEGKTIIGKKKEQNRRWKGPASHNYSLKGCCNTPELPQPCIILAWYWQCLFISKRRQVSRNKSWKATKPGQVHTECWSTLERYRNANPIPSATTYTQTNKFLKRFSALASQDKLCFRMETVRSYTKIMHLL